MLYANLLLNVLYHIEIEMKIRESCLQTGNFIYKPGISLTKQDFHLQRESLGLQRGFSGYYLPELAKLLQSSIEYTQEKFGDTEYIFVNEKEPDRPMQYMAIKTKVMSMIQEKQLKDDHGELFGFGTHMFRHYYGVKLTEMHLDDWTIARLLGHKRLNNVQHYRKMSNQRMADETREVRQMMSDIIYMSLAGWGEEYEQIRQDD